MANGTWRIARGRSNAQLPLAIVVVLAVLLLLAAKAHLLPFDRARAAVTDWAQPTLQRMNAPVVAVADWLSGIRHFFDVYSENERLRRENAALRQWQGAATMLEARAKQYQRLLNSVADPAVTSVAARVIGHSSRPFSETMILNAGAKDHVKPGETVADARGVLGRIYLAGVHTSWVILLTDLNSSIPVSIEPSNDQAILAGDNTEAPVLEAVAQGAKLKEGQEVVTSGNGGLMPPGLPIGQLVKDGQTYRVALFADPGNADDVRIMDFHEEQMPALKPNDLPAIAAGFKPSPPPPESAVATSAPPPGAPVLTPPPGAPVLTPPQRGVGVAKPDAALKPAGQLPASNGLVTRPAAANGSSPVGVAQLPPSPAGGHATSDSDHRTGTHSPGGLVKNREHTVRSPIEIERAREKAAMAREGIAARISPSSAAPKGLDKKRRTRRANSGLFDDDMPPPPPPQYDEQDR
ncbi:MAG TPA: rod shape-determining protein MreC [Rhizomicrobium sp.]|jgi:rod shape-determining protein MreC